MAPNTLSQSIIDMNIPVLLVFKRQAIRVFPDGTRVATYFNDRINKTITIPYTNIGITESMNINELSTSKLKAYRRKSRNQIDRKIEADHYNFKSEISDKQEKNRDTGISRATKKIEDRWSPLKKKLVKKWTIDEELDKDEIEAYKQRRIWRKKSKEKVNESDKQHLKQVKKWINNTRITAAAGEYNGKPTSRFDAHLDNLNKDKKELKKAIKAKFKESKQ